MKTSKNHERLTVDGYTFSEGELEWARDNLASMRRSVQNNTVLYITMAITFILGLVIYLVAVSISTQVIQLPENWRGDFIADLLYNLGITLWTSVILVLFLEVTVEYQRRRWQRYIQLVERVLKQQGYPVDDLSDPVNDNILVRLDEIARRLAAIESLQAEIREQKDRNSNSPAQ